LLFTLRARPLASLGAIITILALAFDPFIQQILQYPSRLSVDHDKAKEASVFRSSNFAIEPTSTDWLNALSAGIWSGAERYTQQPTCPSGNCKWEEYSSIGWCSKCQDATSYAKITDCRFDANSLDIDRLNTTGSCSVDFGHGRRFQVLGSYEAYKVTESAPTSNTTRTSIIATMFNRAVWPLALLDYNLSIPLDNEPYAGVTNPILALGNVHVQWCDEGLCITFAEECALSLCKTQFETSVVHGITNITITNEDFGCLSKVQDDRSTESTDVAGELEEGTDTHCWQAERPCNDLHFTNHTPFHGADYSYPELRDFCSHGTIVQTAQLFYGTPPDTFTTFPTVQRKLLTRLTGNQTTLLSTFGGLSKDNELVTSTTASSVAMDYIAANGLEPVLAGVAASLTQQALLANTSEKVSGTVWTTETYVAVDWPWLLYPATLVLGAIILLALTAIHSHRCGLRTWKSSMLPLLYRSLDPNLLARQPVLQDVSTMTGVAGKAKVTLVDASRQDRVVLAQ
jgi:hypothetical protein